MNTELNNILTEIDRLKVELDNAQPLPIEALKKMLPSVTMDYLSSEKGRTVAEKLIHEHNEN